MKLPWVHKLVAAWMRILLTLSISYVSLECSHHDLSLPAAEMQEMQQKLRMQIILQKILLYTHHWELMKSNEKSWQHVTAICDEGDGLTLCEQLSLCHDYMYCHVTFEVFLWRFLWNLIDLLYAWVEWESSFHIYPSQCMAWFGIHCCMSSVWCIHWSLSFQ